MCRAWVRKRSTGALRVEERAGDRLVVRTVEALAGATRRAAAGERARRPARRNSRARRCWCSVATRCRARSRASVDHPARSPAPRPSTASEVGRGVDPGPREGVEPDRPGAETARRAARQTWSSRRDPCRSPTTTRPRSRMRSACGPGPGEKAKIRRLPIASVTRSTSAWRSVLAPEHQARTLRNRSRPKNGVISPAHQGRRRRWRDGLAGHGRGRGEHEGAAEHDANAGRVQPGRGLELLGNAPQGPGSTTPIGPRPRPATQRDGEPGHRDRTTA